MYITMLNEQYWSQYPTSVLTYIINNIGDGAIVRAFSSAAGVEFVCGHGGVAQVEVDLDNTNGSLIVVSASSADDNWVLARAICLHCVLEYMSPALREMMVLIVGERNPSPEQ